ncbi:hypothetical protein XENTR_v10001195 [Xenopus tropicalis]|nr:hypothetical protein XENTR_v10001195 [Xenopus tropicalis]
MYLFLQVFPHETCSHFSTSSCASFLECSFFWLLPGLMKSPALQQFPYDDAPPTPHPRQQPFLLGPNKMSG